MVWLPQLLSLRWPVLRWPCAGSLDAEELIKNLVLLILNNNNKQGQQHATEVQGRRRRRQWTTMESVLSFVNSNSNNRAQ